MVLYGLPISFVLGIIWGGVMAFQRQAEQYQEQAQGYDPMKYRS